MTVPYLLPPEAFDIDSHLDELRDVLGRSGVYQHGLQKRRQARLIVEQLKRNSAQAEQPRAAVRRIQKVT